MSWEDEGAKDPRYATGTCLTRRAGSRTGMAARECGTETRWGSESSAVQGLGSPLSYIPLWKGVGSKADLVSPPREAPS